MYPVLASTMQILGRPQEDIERVLLSQVDFTGTDVPNMIYSGAYLTRFGAEAQALKMYRQASELQDTRAEPYVMGLKLAQKLNDYDAIRWAACGILTNAWTKNFEQLHRDAENAAEDACRELIELGRRDEAAALERAVAEAKTRDLIVRLTWSGDGDVDLIVEEPWGTICSIDNPQTTSGGVLVHDGAGPDQDQCYDEYVCARGASGYYRVRIRHVFGRIVGKRARLEVIRYAGTDHELRRTYTITLGEDDASLRVSLNQGRRSQRQTISPEDPELDSRRRQGTLLQLVGPLGGAGQQAGQRFANATVTRNAVGYQPITQLLSDGVTMGAMAVVSGDRRYVRLSVNPAINTITDVFTFSFINSGNPNGGGGGNGIRAGGNP